MGPRAVILGGASPLRAAHRLGAECVYVAPGPVSGWKRELADRVVELDFTRTDELCRVLSALHAQRPVRCVLSMTEQGLLPAAVGAHHLGLPATSVATVARLRDKAAMRAALGGPDAVSSAVCGGAEDVRAFGSRHGYPCIVKPTDGSASRGVTRVERPDDVDAAVARQGATTFLVEELLVGSEYSVETLSGGGRHRVVAVTEKFVSSGFVEIGHVVPARLSPSRTADVGAVAVALLDAVGLRDGAAHTEVILTAGGPRIVESHNRVGGDRINELVRMATGVDLVEAAVAQALGVDLPWPAADATAPAEGTRAAAIRFLVPSPGRVRAIDGLAAVRAHPDLVELELAVAVGDDVREVRESADRSGFVLVKGKTATEAVATSTGLADRVTITTDGGP